MTGDRLWTPDAFRAIGYALYGTGWQSALAHALGISARTVRRWAAGSSPVPDNVRRDLTFLARLGDIQGLAPLDEWVIGAPPRGRRRQYIIHTARPRFIAQLGPGNAITRIDWLDAPPLGGDLQRLLDAAADAVLGRSDAT